MAGKIKEALKQTGEGVKDVAGKAASGAKQAGKAASGLLNKAHDSVSHALDANGDGKFDFNDIKSAAEGVGNKAQKAAASIKHAVKESGDKIREKNKNIKFDADLKELRPVFIDDTESPDFSLTKLLRITVPDKKHLESEACKDSIGYVTKTDEIDYINIYKQNTDQLGLSFYPDKESGLYYVDPIDRDHYISLEEYFNYMKIVRINELQRIAQDLGAKHFSVKYMQIKSEVDKSSVKGKAKVSPVKAEAEHELSRSNYSSIQIAAEMDCLGHAPVAPELHYLAKEDVIQNLITMRLNGNVMKRNKYTLHLINTSGLKVKDAIKIDAAIKKTKESGAFSIMKDAVRESNSIFEYEIEF